MSFNPAPAAFFGPGYSESAAAITLKTSEASGVTTGTTFQGSASGNSLTFATNHNLKVGDRVRVTQGTTLPAGLSAGVDYYVKYVTSSTVIKLSTSKGGPLLDLTTDGTADNTLQAYGPLELLTDAEIDGTTGDWREVIRGLIEMCYQKYSNTDTADRPTYMTITRSTSTNDTTGVRTTSYQFQFKTDAPMGDLFPEA